MTPERDDDALSWAGESDPTLDAGVPKPADVAHGADPAGTKEAPDAPDGSESTSGENAPAALPEPAEGWSVVGPTSAVDARNAAAAPSSFTLVVMGILAGIYLLYTIGWFIGVSRIANPLTDPLGQFMFSLGLWLAVFAPVIWFGAVYWRTVAHPRARIWWLLLGVVVLAPLPFIFGAGSIS